MSQWEQVHLLSCALRTRRFADDEFAMDDDWLTDTESVTSGAVFSVIEKTVATTNTSIDDENVSMRSPSPEFDAVVEMDEPLRNNLYKQEFGRNLNSYSEVYTLPADEEELDRLERQYDMLNSLIGHKYVPPMTEVLVDDGSELQKAVLDLGTGSGNWIIDVARDFPHCSAVAIDLTPMKVIQFTCRNRGEVDDINLGLEHYYGQFNVVHARLVAIGVKDYYRLIDQISEVLRPGGLIDLTEVGYVAYDRHHQPIPVVDPTSSTKFEEWGRPYWAHWLRAVANVARVHHGGEINASRAMKEWLDRHRAYTDVVHSEFWLPIIPGDYDRPPAEANFLKEFRIALEYDVLTFLRSGRPMLLRAGYDESILLNVERGIFDEMRSANEPQYSRIECVYAKKAKVIPPLPFDALP
ncbi:hypothetical protein AN958_06791 [Leucoagaricus sp. SymC.cos]|nr:hypothetical protein AN958_06791 [Leucoagaricus sp. SymC.cos]